MVKKIERLRVLFVDQINVLSLLNILTTGRSYKTIWYFDPTTKFAKLMFHTFRCFGLIRFDLCQIENHIGQVRNRFGESQYIKLLSDVRTICDTIKRKELSQNSLIKKMGSRWKLNKILLYFDKLIEIEMRTECLRIGLIEWMLRTQLHIPPDKSVLLIKRNYWFSYIKRYGNSFGISLIAYGHYWFPRKISFKGYRIFRILGYIRVSLFKLSKSILSSVTKPNRLRNLKNEPKTKGQPKSTKIAIRYYYRKLSFHPNERSEFFWLNGSDIPYSEILLYDFISEEPLDADTIRQIDSKGVKLLGRGPGISRWVPTGLIIKTFSQTVVEIVTLLFTCLANKQWISPYYIGHFMKLAIEYAYWYDFYATNRVRINVGTNNLHVAQVLAMDDLDGVTFAYQYSASNIYSPTASLTAGENVQFVFSGAFEQLRHSIDAPVDNFVRIGFIFDGAFKAIRNFDRVNEIRKQIQDNGARFILCFFDENSLNRWDIYASENDAANDYEYLLKWLLSDPTLGIIFKPKKPEQLLFKRISRLYKLIDQANQTGRCKFLTSEYIFGSIYPTEAALMADLCIGKLDGSTAALEAFLTGVTTVLIDIEGLRSHPFYNWGCDRVVFKNWESLRKSIEQYRVAPDANPEFGNWSPGLEYFDPFQDGKACERMRLYIHWVYEALNQGNSRTVAMGIANDRFKKKWGNEHVAQNKI
jgi:hypothetical protein